MTDVFNRETMQEAAAAQAKQVFAGQIVGSGPGMDNLRTLTMSLAGYQYHEQSGWESDKSVGDFVRNMRPNIERENTRSEWLRGWSDERPNSRAGRIPSLRQLIETRKAAGGEVTKSILDVGTATNFAQMVGGQAVGYMSLDTRLYRATIRPNSFTLYNLLRKSQAFQVVDLWSTAQGTGGPPAGAAFAQFGTLTSGALATSAGEYALNTLFLKLAVNGRAITIPLASQNNFVDITSQETANAALTCLTSIDWASYWGNSTLYPSQPQGIYQNLVANASGNIYDFQSYYNNLTNVTTQAGLFNLIYLIAGHLVKQYTFTHITHAVMDPDTAADLQGLTQTQLNNLITLGNRIDGIWINTDLQGMTTRFGQIQFPVDLVMGMRDVPVQAYVNGSNQTQATTSSPTPPATVSVAAATGTSSSWTSAYRATSGQYVYAVASTDANMNESQVTYSAVVSGVAANGSYTVTVTGPANGDATNFRIFRSGLGYTATSSQNPASFRWIKDVAVNTTNASGTVTFTDDNSWIPGSQAVFLLDLDDSDGAIDYRVLLPLTKVNLFAQNIYMPWAICGIGAIRVTIPKFHAIIKNYVPSTPTWNPLSNNLPVQGFFGGL